MVACKGEHQCHIRSHTERSTGDGYGAASRIRHSEILVRYRHTAHGTVSPVGLLEFTSRQKVCINRDKSVVVNDAYLGGGNSGEEVAVAVARVVAVWPVAFRRIYARES